MVPPASSLGAHHADRATRASTGLLRCGSHSTSGASLHVFGYVAMDTSTSHHYLYVGVILIGAGCVVVSGRPTEPSWLWEPVSPSEGTCQHFKGNMSRNGYISTPKYPDNYPDSLHCELLLYVPLNHMVRMYFIDFALEASRSCWLDRLEVLQLDMYEYTSPIGSFCGREMPPLVVGFEPSLKLVFTSDRYVSARGFRARIEFLPLI